MGGVPEDMMLEKEPRVLHFVLQAAEGVCHTKPRLTTDENSNPCSTVTHIFQQSHTYSNKATSPNSEAPYVPNIHAHGSIWAIPIQTITRCYQQE